MTRGIRLQVCFVPLDEVLILKGQTMKDIISTKETCKYIGLSKSKVYQLIRQKKIPAFKIDRQYKFSKEIIRTWLKENDIRKNL